MKKELTYRESIRHFFVLYALIPLVILMMIALVTIMVMPAELVKEKTKENIITLSDRVVSMQDDYEEFIYYLAGSDELYEFMETGKDLEAVNSIFYSYNNRNAVSSILHLMDPDGTVVYSSKKLKMRSEQYLRIAVIPRLERADGDIVFEYNRLFYEAPYANSFSVAKAIMKDGQILGYCLLQLSTDDLGLLLQISDNDIVVLTDSFGNLIYTNYNKAHALGLKFSPDMSSRRVLSIDGSQFYYSKFRSVDRSLVLYNLNLIRPHSSIYIIIILITLFFGFFFFILLQLLSNRMVLQSSKSMDRVITAIGNIQIGEYGLPPIIESNDEFQLLARQYKNLVVQIKELLTKNEELARLKRNSEVKLLEAQFSPHFMLNVLETLRYSLYIDIDLSHQIINMLSNQLKYSLYNLKENRLLSDELKYIEEYIKLHQIRFDNRIEYEIVWQENLKNAVVPKLILQPMIENSIKYGFRYQDDLKISVLIAKIDADLKIEITDNGKGLTDEAFQSLSELLMAERWPDSHIGLYGINKRMILLYGEGYHLEIVNCEGCSFTVILRLPYIAESPPDGRWMEVEGDNV